MVAVLQSTASEGGRRVLRADADEMAAHAARLEQIRKKAGGRLLWQMPGENVPAG